MQIARVNGVELEFEDVGSGEPVLLISAVIANGVAPLAAEPILADRYRTIRYHKRGWCSSTHTPGPVPVAAHVADAIALLDHLGIGRAHIVGHSSGALVGAQLAIDAPDRVATLSLLEPTPLALPGGAAVVAAAAPVFEAFAAGDHETAVAGFLSFASGLEWDNCRATLEATVPNAVTDAVKDAETFFGIELPALIEWPCGPEQAAAIHAPVLSVLGANTLPFWVDVAAFLRESVEKVEEQTIAGVGHFLHMEQPEPVARVIADFLGRHPMVPTR